MLNSIIIDDELKSRESLRILLEDFCDDVAVSALCQNVTEGLAAIETHKPQVVFLDIQMQRETGFDFLERVKQIDFEIIFTTAYSEYAIRAFKYSAIDYLLKPISIEQLKRAVLRVEKKVLGDFSTRLDCLVQNLKPSPNHRLKLALPSSEGLVFVKIEDIVYCEASSNYTNIFMQDGERHIVSRTLKEYDELLTGQNFFRIHNSYLINLNAIKRYVRGEGGYVVMNNNASLDVSKRKKEAFLAHISSRE